MADAITTTRISSGLAFQWPFASTGLRRRRAIEAEPFAGSTLDHRCKETGARRALRLVRCAPAGPWLQDGPDRNQLALVGSECQFIELWRIALCTTDAHDSRGLLTRCKILGGGFGLHDRQA